MPKVVRSIVYARAEFPHRFRQVFLYSTPLESLKGVIAISALSASNLFGPRSVASSQP